MSFTRSTRVGILSAAVVVLIALFAGYRMRQDSRAAANTDALLDRSFEPADAEDLTETAARAQLPLLLASFQEDYETEPDEAERDYALQRLRPCFARVDWKRWTRQAVGELARQRGVPEPELLRQLNTAARHPEGAAFRQFRQALGEILVRIAADDKTLREGIRRAEADFTVWWGLRHEEYAGLVPTTSARPDTPEKRLERLTLLERRDLVLGVCSGLTEQLDSQLRESGAPLSAADRARLRSDTFSLAKQLVTPDFALRYTRRLIAELSLTDDELAALLSGEKNWTEAQSQIMAKLATAQIVEMFQEEAARRKLEALVEKLLERLDARPAADDPGESEAAAAVPASR